jgi:predicted nucleotide-binding protein with TIR-like domain
METFGKHLLRFAHAIDIVSKHALDEVKDMIWYNLENQLDAKFCEFLVPMRLDGKIVLNSIWHPGGAGWAYSIFTDQGKYNGQISYAWDKERSVWIVGNGCSDLASCDNYIDLLNPNLSKEIPKYIGLTNHSIKTSIICLVPHDKEIIGILNIESTKCFKKTKILQDEIQYIVESLGLLYSLHKTNEVQSSTTNKALKTLEGYKNSSLPIIPRVFLASSAIADNAVTVAIGDVLNKYDIDFKYWKADAKPGNVPDHIWKNISSSEIGICYLSEPDETPIHKYRDNYNVIFEAGMIHALIRNSNNAMCNCILIREKNSPHAPFNFSTERILEVPRNTNGELNKLAFSTELKRMLDETQIPRRS